MLVFGGCTKNDGLENVSPFKHWDILGIDVKFRGPVYNTIYGISRYVSICAYTVFDII